MGLPEHGGGGYLADRSICMPEIVRAMPVVDGVYLDNVKWQQILKTRGIRRGTCRGDSHLALYDLKSGRVPRSMLQIRSGTSFLDR